MATTTPSKSFSFDFPSGSLSSLAPAGLDVGHVFAKVAYVDSTSDRDLLHCASFPVDQLATAIQYLKSKANPKPDARLHVTGQHAVAAAAVREVWGSDAILVTKLNARIAGSHFLIGKLPQEQLELPKESGTNWELQACMANKYKEFMTKFKEEREKKEKECQSDGMFPIVVANNGNLQTTWLAVGNEEVKNVTVSPMAGQFFTGLIDLMVGHHQSFEQIEETAAKGIVQNVDTVVKEMLSTNPKSPYGSFPEDMPIFTFGKAFDNNKGLSEFAKEDIAASLVRIMTIASLTDVMGLVMFGGAKKIYVGGSFFAISTARKTWDEYVQTYFKVLGAETIFIKLEHACALGAMLADKDGQLDSLKVERV